MLFTVYINNIISVLNESNAHLYADDTFLYCFSHSTHLAVEIFKPLICLEISLVSSILILIASKAKFRLFSRTKVLYSNSLYLSTLVGNDIGRVTESRYLAY